MIRPPHHLFRVWINHSASSVEDVRKVKYVNYSIAVQHAVDYWIPIIAPENIQMFNVNVKKACISTTKEFVFIGKNVQEIVTNAKNMAWNVNRSTNAKNRVRAFLIPNYVMELTHSSANVQLVMFLHRPTHRTLRVYQKNNVWSVEDVRKVKYVNNSIAMHHAEE